MGHTLEKYRRSVGACRCFYSLSQYLLHCVCLHAPEYIISAAETVAWQPERWLMHSVVLRSEIYTTTTLPTHSHTHTQADKWRVYERVFPGHSLLSQGVSPEPRLCPRSTKSVWGRRRNTSLVSAVISYSKTLRLPAAPRREKMSREGGQA